MKCDIRPEAPTDYVRIREIIQSAFAVGVHSDQTEHLLVEQLRKGDTYIPELALVAELDEQVVGFILFTKVAIRSKQQEVPALALAPVAVSPKYQGQGIGGALIQAGHAAAQQAGFSLVVLIGHAEYYPQFGYDRASKYGITFPFLVPDEAAMVYGLRSLDLDAVGGEVVYPAAFFPEDLL